MYADTNPINPSWCGTGILGPVFQTQVFKTLFYFYFNKFEPTISNAGKDTIEHNLSNKNAALNIPYLNETDYFTFFSFPEGVRYV